MRVELQGDDGASEQAVPGQEGVSGGPIALLIAPQMVARGSRGWLGEQGHSPAPRH